MMRLAAFTTSWNWGTTCPAQPQTPAGRLAVVSIRRKLARMSQEHSAQNSVTTGGCHQIGLRELDLGWQAPCLICMRKALFIGTSSPAISFSWAASPSSPTLDWLPAPATREALSERKGSSLLKDQAHNRLTCTDWANCFMSWL